MVYMRGIEQCPNDNKLQVNHTKINMLPFVCWMLQYLHILNENVVWIVPVEANLLLSDKVIVLAEPRRRIIITRDSKENYSNYVET